VQVRRSRSRMSLQRFIHAILRPSMGVVQGPEPLMTEDLSGSALMPRTALLLIAHGSRHAEANADLLHVVAELRQQGIPVVEPAFLELAEPGIDAAAEACIRQGADRVVLVPYFLSAGVHVRRDLADARERLGKRYPHASWILAEPLGRHPLLLQI